jgi:hypothetical protein
MGSEAVAITISPAIIDLQVFALSPPKFLQRLFQRLRAGSSFWVTLGILHENADAPHPIRLLRACGKWPRRRAAEKRDELAPLHLPP